MALKEKAEELANAIAESNEFQEMKAVEGKIADDKEAQQIMNDFQSKQQQLQMAQMNGQEINDELKTDLQSLRAKMQENQTISELMEKQQQFNKIMDQVNNKLSTAINGEQSGCGDHNHSHGHGCSGGCC